MVRLTLRSFDGRVLSDQNIMAVYKQQMVSDVAEVSGAPHPNPVFNQSLLFSASILTPLFAVPSNHLFLFENTMRGVLYKRHPKIGAK
jgi:hypothetical protein